MDDTLIIIFISIGIFIILILAIIGIASAKSRSIRQTKTKEDILEANRFGKEGEEQVSRSLRNITYAYGGYLYDEFCFEYKKGFSSEIDHLLITNGGVFVIETKNNKGYIDGGTNDKDWTCIKKDYQKDKIFRNPIRQNQRHINHLRRLFKNTPPKMISIVIFPNADISGIDSDTVFNLKDAEEHIIKTISSRKYSKQYVERINNQIKDIQNKYGISKEKHIKNIHRIYQ